uniref:Muscle-restricted coiled-coil protein n=1 Tax=Apteryx owenii TaxID=8824 RepID=A0A8B9SEF7_APTOW
MELRSSLFLPNTLLVQTLMWQVRQPPLSSSPQQLPIQWAGSYTIVTVLDKVANIVDSVQASQKRIEERHREMENAIKTIQIDILKLAQAHGNTGYTVNKLLEKTHKVSSTVKEVRARVERQSANVQKVEAKQEEMLRKNKFRVVIYQRRKYRQESESFLELE